MTFSEYQSASRKTARYPVIGHPIVYPALGLAGEAGEVAGKIKKIFRDKNGIIDDATLKAIQKELGDVLWYVSQLSTELGLTLEDVAALNIENLLSRLERGTIHGDGDDR